MVSKGRGLWWGLGQSPNLAFGYRRSQAHPLQSHASKYDEPVRDRGRMGRHRLLPDRRQLLRGGLSLLGALAVPAGPAAAAPPADLGALELRFSWIKNAQFAGDYLADSRGYYRDEGFSTVTLLGSGPSAPPTEIDLVQDKCLLGYSSIEATATAAAQGAELRTIGGLFQRSAFCLLSLADRPIPEPAAMIGRRIGVPASDQLVFETFMRLSRIDPARVHIVPVQFDPSQLVNGDVDGWVGLVSNEPNVLRVMGIPSIDFLFADHGYPLVMQTYVARQSSIRQDRTRLKAALRAEIRGWRDNLRDPEAGVLLAVNQYGRTLGLDPRIERLVVQTQNTLIVSADTHAHGLLVLRPELIERNIEVLRDLGNDVSASGLFDMSLLDEIYRDDPSLLQA